MKFIYPPIKNLNPSPNTKSLTFDNLLTNSNYSSDLGSFIIGKNKVFHGGINLVIPNEHGLQAVADGHIIAYRVSKECQSIEHVDKKQNTKLEFSNNFILVEHDFDQFQYIKCLDDSLIANPYAGYKFYTLYMHIMPLEECINQKILPDWLVLDKKSNPALLRGEKLKPKVLSFTKGFTVARTELSDKIIKISEKDIVNINGENYLNKMLDMYDTSDTPVIVLDKFFSTNDVVVLDDQTKISVKAGELLGYAGKSQASSIDQSQVNFMHFEIWLDSIDFLTNNIINQYASYISNNLNSTMPRNIVFNNLDIRSLGYSYIKSNNRYLTFESLCFVEEPTTTDVCARIKGSLDAQKGSITQFLTSVLNNQKETLYTDADWLTNPANKWKIYRQSDFFNIDGSIKESDFKNKYSNFKDWKKLQDRAIIKLEYSEWDKKYFDQKYNFLLTKKSKFFSKIDKNTFQTLKKYQESVSFLDKTAGSGIVPEIHSLYAVNPVEFLVQMKRCMFPGPPTANTHLVKRLIQYALDENVYLVKKY